MRRIFGINNLGLKALALVLALLMWVFLYLIQPGKLPFGILLKP